MPLRVEQTGVPVRVVFLDIDGVITTAASYKDAPRIEAPRKSFYDDPVITWTNMPGLLVPELVANVQALCAASEASVVISSHWRLERPLEVVPWLQAAGLTATILGITPIRDTRIAEIMAWMSEHGVKRQDIVILEDEHGCGSLRGRQIKTSFTGPEQGFTAEHLRLALRLWGIGPRTRGSNRARFAY